jgi:hypothetical protein
MQITDEVISRFWGKGKGFVVTSIKRYGGVFANEELLEEAHYLSMVSAMKARDTNKVFESELHMINYMMRLCYWASCKAYEDLGKRVSTLNESDLIYDDLTNTPIMKAVSDLIEDPDSFNESVITQVRERYGDHFAEITKLSIIEGLSVKETAHILGATLSSVYLNVEKIKRYLRFKIKKDSI